MLVVDYLFISLFTCSVDHLSAAATPRTAHLAHLPPHRSASLPFHPLIVHFCDVVHHHGTSFSTQLPRDHSSLASLLLLRKSLHTETKLIAVSRPRPSMDHRPTENRYKRWSSGHVDHYCLLSRRHQPQCAQQCEMICKRNGMHGVDGSMEEQSKQVDRQTIKWIHRDIVRVKVSLALLLHRKIER